MDSERNGISQALFCQLNLSLSVAGELSMVQSFRDAMEPATRTLEALRSPQVSLLARMQDSPGEHFRRLSESSSVARELSKVTSVRDLMETATRALEASRFSQVGHLARMGDLTGESLRRLRESSSVALELSKVTTVRDAMEPGTRALETYSPLNDLARTEWKR